MPDKCKRPRNHLLLAPFAVMVAARLSFGGAGSPPDRSGLERQPVSTVWHVTYRGGPNVRRENIEVDLQVSADTISYAAADGQPGSESSIPVADVTDVSDAIIEGNLSEKVYGPGEPDFITPLRAFSNFQLAELFLPPALAAEIPSAIVYSILSSIPYKDRFIRVDWQRDGEKLAAVFQVTGKDFTPLREELESVTEKTLGSRAPEQPPHEALSAGPAKPIEVLNPGVARLRVQRWLSEQCQSESLGRPSWLKPPPNRKTLSLCPSTTTEANEAQKLLLAK